MAAAFGVWRTGFAESEAAKEEVVTLAYSR
jgi:hypothetical protein